MAGFALGDAGDFDGADSELLTAFSDALHQGDVQGAEIAWSTWDELARNPPARAREFRAIHAELLSADPALAWAETLASYAATDAAEDVARCGILASRAAPYMFAEKLAELGSSEPDADGWQLYAYGMGIVFAGEWERALEPTQAALVWARAHRDRALEADALYTLSSIHAYKGESEQAARLLQSSLTLADRLGDVELARRARINLTETLSDNLDSAGATRAARDAVSWASGLHRPTKEQYEFEVIHAHHSLLAGNGTDAVASLARASTIVPDPKLIDGDIYVPTLLSRTMVEVWTQSPNTTGNATDEALAATDAWGFDSYSAGAYFIKSERCLFLLDAAGAAESSRATEHLAPDELVSRLRARFAATLAAHLAPDEQPAYGGEELEIAGPLPRLYARSIAAIEQRDESAMSAVARLWDRGGRNPMSLLMRLAAGASSRTIELEAIQLGLDGIAALAGRLQGRADETPSIVINWWKSGPDTDRAQLAFGAETLELAAGSITCMEAGYLRSIDKGVASVWQGRTAEAPSYAGYPICTGDLLGAGETLQGETGTPLVIRAITDLTITEYLIASVGAIAEKSGSLALDLGRQTAAQLQRSTEQIHDLATQSADVRLARCLLSLSERIGRPTLHGERLIDAVFTNADLAAMIGSQRARVNRFLTDLRKGGAITEFKRKIVVADTAALREYAKLDSEGHEIAASGDGSASSITLAG